MENEHSAHQISRFLDYVEGPGHKKLQGAIGILGTMGTIAMWCVRLHRIHLPAIKINVLVLLAPPYLMLFGFCNAFARHDTGPHTTGPMSGYLQHEESARRWRVRVAAGIVAVFNLFLMVFGSPWG